MHDQWSEAHEVTCTSEIIDTTITEYSIHAYCRKRGERIKRKTREKSG